MEDRAFIKLLKRDLDNGEAEAIALATQLNAKWLLIDEREGRKIARSLGLKITGVLGIILKGWYENEVESVKKSIEQLRTKANFYIAPNLERQILSETDELDRK